MNALVLSEPNTVETRSVPKPSPGASEVLVRVGYLGVCGTDLELFRGSSAYLQSGATNYPIRFGHEWSGVVVETGVGVSSDWVGRRVTGLPFVSCGQCSVCRGGMYNLCPSRSELGVRGNRAGAGSEYFSVPTESVARIPDRVGTREALLAEPAVTVLNGFRAARLTPGDSVVVVGTGTLGLIAVQVAASAGCNVTVIGIDEPAKQLAREFGATKVLGPEDVSGPLASVIIEASGSPDVGSLILDAARPGARISQLGIPHKPVLINTSELVAKGLTLTGVLGGVDLLDRALQLIAEEVIVPDSLLYDVLPAHEADAAFQALAQPRRAPKIVLNLSDESWTEV